MAFATFVQDISITAAPEIVRGLLAEMNNRSEMHPLIVQIQHINTTTAPDGTQVEAYRIRDRMKLGIFTIRFTYRANMSVNADGDIVSDAYQWPGVHLHTIITYRAEGSGSHIREHIEITAPRLLMKTTYDAAVSSHQKMMANLKKSAETVEQTTI